MKSITGHITYCVATWRHRIQWILTKSIGSFPSNGFFCFFAFFHSIAMTFIRFSWKLLSFWPQFIKLMIVHAKWILLYLSMRLKRENVLLQLTQLDEPRQKWFVCEYTSDDSWERITYGEHRSLCSDNARRR